MEFVGDDTLKEKIQKTRMNENDIRYYLAEIISVIQYLHSNKIVHRYVYKTKLIFIYSIFALIL
jgi:serine/threonine protein kinase